MQQQIPDDPSVPQIRAGSVFVGLDLVDVRRIRESVDRFGERFVERVFTPEEMACARLGTDWCAERLAARFAAKEAAIKAFDLGETGIGWLDIEVCKLPGGACRLALHGKAAVRAAGLGIEHIALSLSHDGDYAGAIVTASRSARGVLSNAA